MLVIYGLNPRVIAQSNTLVSHTGDTNETALASIALPANQLRVGDSCEITTLWSMTNNANSKASRVRFGLANDLSGSGFLASGNTSVAELLTITRICVRGSSSQVGGSGASPSGFFAQTGSNVTSSIDITQPTFIVISGSVSNSADTITLRAYTVLYLPGS